MQATQRYSEVLLNCAGFEDIENRIRQVGLKYNRMILSDEMPVEEASEKIKREIEPLTQKKLELLKKAGYDENYLNEVHVCDICCDTGFIGKPDGDSRRCSCYNQMLIDSLYETSNIILNDGICFESFDPCLFSEKTDTEKYGFDTSPRENISMIRDFSVDFIKTFISGTCENLYFFGRPGTGKTFISLCIAKCLLAKGVTVLYMSAPSLFNTITEYRTKVFRDDNYSDVPYKSIIEADLLIVDDLGTESMTPARYSDFLTVLNSRSGTSAAHTQKSVILSTNMDLKALRKTYDERIVSRIIGSFKIIPFFGEDLRPILSRRR